MALSLGPGTHRAWLSSSTSTGSAVRPIAATWLAPLNIGLGHLALSPLDVERDDILDIDYSEVLRAKYEVDVEPPPVTLLDAVPDAAEDRFRRMTEQARLAVQRFGTRGTVNLDVAPRWLVAAAAGPVSSRLRDAADLPDVGARSGLRPAPRSRPDPE